MKNKGVYFKLHNQNDKVIGFENIDNGIKILFENTKFDDEILYLNEETLDRLNKFLIERKNQNTEQEHYGGC